MPIANKQVAKAVYDFSVDGTASGDIALAITERIPANAKITNVWTNELTALTGSTDIDIVLGAEVIVTAVDFTGDAGFQARTVAKSVASAGFGNIMIHNDGSAITAGKLEIFVEYMY